jgi:phage tail sheath protein FI
MGGSAFGTGTPGVTVQEIDLSQVIGSVPTSTGALVIYSPIGPVGVPTFIGSQAELIQTFGDPIVGNPGHYSAMAFLKQSNSLYVVRVINGSLYGGVRIYATSDANPNSAIASGFTAPTFQTVSGHQLLFYIFGANQGSWNNNISVTVSAVNAVTNTFTITVYYSGVIVETWNVSRTQGSLDGYGRNNYLMTAINGISQYITVADSTLPASTVLKTQSTPLSLGAGCDGISPTDGQYIAGWNLFSNKRIVQVQILINGGLIGTNCDIQDAIINIAQTRMDCIAILDAPYSPYDVTDLLTFRNTTLNANTSYAALYAPWVYVYDAINDTNVYLPPSGYVAGQYAYNDYIAEPWFAPAGLTRGVIPNIQGLATIYSDGDVGVLYNNQINCIWNPAPGKGFAVWGQKTLTAINSALTRVNVRRLCIVLETAIGSSLQDFVFEPTDTLTELRITQALDQYLRGVEAGNGIYNYTIVCDDTNNTQQTIDNNQLIVGVYIQPTIAAEYVLLQLVLTPTGVSVQSITGAGAIPTSS